MTKNPEVAQPGIVQHIIEPAGPGEPETAEIVIEGPYHPDRDIRIENVLKDGAGKKVKLKRGSQVDVIVEADPKETTPIVLPPTAKKD